MVARVCGSRRRLAIERRHWTAATIPARRLKKPVAPSQVDLWRWSMSTRRTAALVGAPFAARLAFAQLGCFVRASDRRRHPHH
jgi:hypothetical protein